MTIDSTAEQILDNLSQEYIDALIQRVCDMMAGYAKKQVETQNIKEQISNQITNNIEQVVNKYFFSDSDSIAKEITTEFKTKTENFLNLLAKNIQDKVIADLKHHIGSQNYVEYLHDITQRTVKDTVESVNFKFPDACIPARALVFDEFKISADKIDNGTIKHFNSTGIEDFASSKTLIVEDNLVSIYGDIEIHGKINQKFIDSIVSTTAGLILQKFPEGTFDFADISKQDIEQLLTLHISKKYHNDIESHLVSNLNSYNIKQTLDQRINDIINSSVTTYQYNNPNSSISGDNSVVNGLLSSFSTKTQQFINDLQSQIQQKVLDNLAHRMSNHDVTETIIEQSRRVIYDMLVRNTVHIPDASIPAKAIQNQHLVISADNISQGIIKNFQSNGIQDRAAQCQMTIDDSHTIIENDVVIKNLQVKGKVRFDQGLEQDIADSLSDLTLTKLESKYQSGTYDIYAQKVFDKIRDEGVSIDHLRHNNKPLFENGTLNYNITKSNLQKVGYLKELQVQGETYLSSTLYTSNKRAGINTLEPEMTLDLWDQEIQIIAGKRSLDVGIIGLPRNQTLILSTNNKNQLLINPDGTISINQLNIGTVRHTSSPDIPLDNRTPGVIVWNERPVIGGPIGWVSLGGARWAGFGTVTE
jgi:hypothetical protein